MVSEPVLGPDGEPVEGIGNGLIDSEPRGFWPWAWGETVPDGTFEIRLLEGWSGSLIFGIYAEEDGVALPCSLLGFYGPGGFTMLGHAATRVEVGDVGATGIKIRLPASPEQLLRARGQLLLWRPSWTDFLENWAVKLPLHHLNGQPELEYEGS